MAEDSRMLKLMYQRKLNKLTQAELADRAGIKRLTINAYESGRRKPDIDTLQKLAAALNCKIDDIV